MCVDNTLCICVQTVIESQFAFTIMMQDVNER